MRAVIGRRRVPVSASMRARMPRRMFTSSRSRPARANSRRSRGSSLRGRAGSRNRNAVSVRRACACSASMSSCVAGSNRGAARRASPSAATRISHAATCTAAARLSDAYAGFAAIVATRRAARELVVGQSRHLACRRRARLRRRRACRSPRPPRARSGSTSPGELARPRRKSDRQRAFPRAPPRASPRRARASRTAVAPDASAVASASGKRAGATSDESRQCPS